MTRGARSLRPSSQAAMHPTPRTRPERHVAHAAVGATADAAMKTTQSRTGGWVAGLSGIRLRRVVAVASGAVLPSRAFVWGRSTGRRRR